MKSIDIKSLLIGALLTSTVIFGVAATGKNGSPNTPNPSSWDKEQQWQVKMVPLFEIPKGWEPFQTVNATQASIRKRIK